MRAYFGKPTAWPCVADWQHYIMAIRTRTRDRDKDWDWDWDWA